MSSPYHSKWETEIVGIDKMLILGWKNAAKLEGQTLTSFQEIILTQLSNRWRIPFVFLNDFSRLMATYEQVASKRGYKLQQCKGAKEALEREEIQLWRKYQPELLGEDRFLKHAL